MNPVAAYYERRRVSVGLGDAVMGEWSATRARADGVAIKHEPYANGPAGVRKSLTEMARLMREARLDAAVAGYAADVLRAAGIDGRNRSGWTARNVVQALLDNVRQVVIYTPDAVGAEVITSPAGQLCLRPNLCIRKEDCDGLTTLLGALVMCVGFEVRICKQSWGSSAQEHVLLVVKDESGQWLKADPSHASLPVGRGVNAHSEEFFDPLDADCAINVGSGAELLTLGSIAGGPHQQNQAPGGYAPNPAQAHAEREHFGPLDQRPHLPGVGKGGHGGGHGGGHWGGGGHGGGGGRSRFHGGQWWDWNGGTWIVSQNFGCRQWGSPIANPDAGLLALARSYAAELPSSDSYNGSQYLFSSENGKIVIRPCVAVSGVGRAVNDQLSPRRHMGVGAQDVEAPELQVVIDETTGLMDATNVAVGSCSAMAPTDVAAWNGIYSAWQTAIATINGCVADSVPSIHGECAQPPVSYSIWSGWSSTKAWLLGQQGQARTWQGKVKLACPTFQPTPQFPVPVNPPGGGGGTTGWLDDVKTVGYVVGGVIVLGTVAYVTSKVVQVASSYATKKPAAAA